MYLELTNVFTTIRSFSKILRGGHNMDNVVLKIPILNIKTAHSLWHPGAYIVATGFPLFLAIQLAFHGLIHVIVQSDCDPTIFKKGKVSSWPEAVVTLNSSTDEGLKDGVKLNLVILQTISIKNQL